MKKILLAFVMSFMTITILSFNSTAAPQEKSTNHGLSDDELFQLQKNGLDLYNKKTIIQENDLTKVFSADLDIFSHNDISQGRISLFSVPKKEVVTGVTTSYKVERRGPIAVSGIMTSISESITLAVTVSGMNFGVTNTYSKTFTYSHSLRAPYNGQFVVYSILKTTHYNIYARSRRPVGRNNWILVGKKTKTEPVNVIVKFERV